MNVFANDEGEVIMLSLFPRPNVVVQASAKVHMYHLPPITSTSLWDGGDTSGMPASLQYFLALVVQPQQQLPSSSSGQSQPWNAEFPSKHSLMSIRPV